MIGYVGMALTALIAYWAIGATVSIVWPSDWPLRLLAAYMWPATLVLLATDWVYGVLGGEEE